jgi:hypothetical protein
VTPRATLLHLGCGRKRYDAAALADYVGLTLDASAAVDVVHLDADPALAPDLVCRLGAEPIPLADDSVDVMVAWHVLEHIGRQGETTEWFAFWEDAYRVLKPDGWIYAESPYYSGIWAWSDPTHARALSEHAFVFFAQRAYRIPGSMISPYRIRCDFEPMPMGGMPQGFRVYADPADRRNTLIRIALRAQKPLAPWWEDPA